MALGIVALAADARALVSTVGAGRGRRSRGRVLLLAACAGIAAAVLALSSSTFSSPTPPRTRAVTRRAGQPGAPMAVTVDLSDGAAAGAPGGAREAIEEAFRSAIEPYADLVEHIDVDVRAEEPQESAGAAAHRFDVSVGLRGQADPIMVSSRRRVDSAAALASKDGLLGRVLSTVVRAVREEHQRDLFRRRADELSEAAGVVDVFGDGLSGADLAEEAVHEVVGARAEGASR